MGQKHLSREAEIRKNEEMVRPKHEEIGAWYTGEERAVCVETEGSGRIRVFLGRMDSTIHRGYLELLNYISFLYASMSKTWGGLWV